jgi:hypothetical protein
MLIPGILYFANNDLGDVALANLQGQLNIDEVISNDEFVLRIAADPNYPVVIKLNQLRVLVLYPAYDQNNSNKCLADILLFIRQGMAYVLDRVTGCPGLAMATNKLNMFNLRTYLEQNCCSPWRCRRCSCLCGCNCFSHLPLPLRRMLIAWWDPSGVHSANCDNEANNPDFIYRNFPGQPTPGSIC